MRAPLVFLAQRLEARGFAKLDPGLERIAREPDRAGVCKARRWRMA
jgi:hypothetical protein